MIVSFITGLWASFKGLPRGMYIIAAGALLIVTGLVLHQCSVSNAHKDGIAEGATAQREANLSETVKNVEKANAAAENVVRNIDAGRAECLRNARNPSDC